MSGTIKRWTGALGLILSELVFLGAHTRADGVEAKGEGRDYTGYVAPVHKARVGPSTAGHVTEVLVDVGQRVKRGDVLARLDDQSAKIGVLLAQAGMELARAKYAELRAGPAKEEIAQAEAALEEAKAQHKQAQMDKDRAMKLGKTGISTRDLDEIIGKERQLVFRVRTAQAALDLLKQGPRKERLAVAEAQIKQAEARLLQAREKLDSTIIRAPFDGVILVTHVQAGDFVDPPSHDRSSAVCDLADVSRLQVVVSIPENDLASISRGQACMVRLSSMPKVKLDGKVARVSPFVDRAKGAAQVRVALESGKLEGKILPGMFAGVRILVKE
jgi:HlyD family secretion protein